MKFGAKVIAPERESVYADIFSRAFKELSRERSWSDDVTDFSVGLTSALVLLFLDFKLL